MVLQALYWFHFVVTLIKMIYKNLFQVYPWSCSYLYDFNFLQCFSNIFCWTNHLSDLIMSLVLGCCCFANWKTHKIHLMKLRYREFITGQIQHILKSCHSKNCICLANKLRSWKNTWTLQCQLKFWIDNDSNSRDLVKDFLGNLLEHEKLWMALITVEKY